MKIGLFRRFFSRWPLAVAAVFFIYSLVLLANAYRSQFQLVAEANAHIAADSRRVAEAVADLISERRKSTVELAECPEVANYLINKALGMSLRYGLNANLAAIEERFRRQLERANLRGEHIFERIVFYDVDGMVLVDLAPSAGILTPLSARGRNPAVLIDPAARHIVVSAPVVFKGEISGKVTTVGDLGQLSRDLIQQ
ncbi:MAG: hybrid sensor histidine kinase/response regulator, partial [Spirochaetota bacterium]